MYVIQHCFICRPFTLCRRMVGSNPGTVATLAVQKRGGGKKEKGYKKVKRKKNKQVDRRNTQSAFLFADFLGRFMWRINSLEMVIKILFYQNQFPGFRLCKLFGKKYHFRSRYADCKFIQVLNSCLIFSFMTDFYAKTTNMELKKYWQV
jgi:hypothetical protein